MTPRCRHRFARRRFWLLYHPNVRWRCLACGLTTRHYDSLDRWQQRPIHVDMSVAYRGMNTVSRRQSRETSQ